MCSGLHFGSPLMSQRLAGKLKVLYDGTDGSEETIQKAKATEPELERVWVIERVGKSRKRLYHVILPLVLNCGAASFDSHG